MAGEKRTIPLRMWRMAKADDGWGMLVWFDPSKERVELRALTGAEELNYLDSLVSVSASGSDRVELSAGESGITAPGDSLELFPQ